MGALSGRPEGSEGRRKAWGRRSPAARGVPGGGCAAALRKRGEPQASCVARPPPHVPICCWRRLLKEGPTLQQEEARRNLEDGGALRAPSPLRADLRRGRRVGQLSSSIFNAACPIHGAVQDPVVMAAPPGGASWRLRGLLMTMHGATRRATYASVHGRGSGRYAPPFGSIAAPLRVASVDSCRVEGAARARAGAGRGHGGAGRSAGCPEPQMGRVGLLSRSEYFFSKIQNKRDAIIYVTALYFDSVVVRDRPAAPVDTAYAIRIYIFIYLYIRPPPPAPPRPPPADCQQRAPPSARRRPGPRRPGGPAPRGESRERLLPLSAFLAASSPALPRPPPLPLSLSSLPPPPPPPPPAAASPCSAAASRAPSAAGSPAPPTPPRGDGGGVDGGYGPLGPLEVPAG
jgi:hypothetical protein